MGLSEWIMKWTAIIAPKDRKDWAAAMAAESAVLKAGRLSWALGCLLTSARWQLVNEAWYCGVIAATITLTMLVLSPWFSSIFFNWLPPGPLTGVYRLSFYVLGWVPVVAASFGLGLWRPNRVLMTATLELAFIVLNAYSIFQFIMHARFGYIHYMDLPPVVGELAVLGYCIGGTWLGAALRKALVPRNLAV